MSESLRIAIAGASGRMGKMLIETVLAADDAELVGALDITAARPSELIQEPLGVSIPESRLLISLKKVLLAPNT